MVAGSTHARALRAGPIDPRMPQVAVATIEIPRIAWISGSPASDSTHAITYATPTRPRSSHDGDRPLGNVSSAWISGPRWSVAALAATHATGPTGADSRFGRNQHAPAAVSSHGTRLSGRRTSPIAPQARRVQPVRRSGTHRAGSIHP